MITYVKDDLFNAPKDQLLVHACNCQGVWGSGIAKQFKDYFYEEYRLYQEYCIAYDGERSLLAGKSLIINNVGCLFTSTSYGHHVDTREKVILNTRNAINELISKTTMKIAMPKINSGLFKVPWEETEKVLKEFPHVEFFVYDPNMESK